MRRFFGFVVALVGLIVIGWVSRPAALGDAGGLYALIDRALPAAASWRAGYFNAAGQTTAANPAANDKAATAAPAKAKGPAAVVVTQPAELKQLDLTFGGVGTVQAIASITIKPRVDGQITSVGVEEGAAVKVGDLLFKFDDQALKAQLAQAEAQIVKDTALLAQNKSDLARDDDLLKQKFIAPQIRETAQTTLNQTAAQIEVDKAQRDGISTSLTYMEIRAPVTGRIGSIATKTGAAVKSGDTLALVNQIDPIYIAFAVPQNKLGELRQAMASDKALVRLRDDPKAPTGKIGFIENTVDSTTGTVQVKAVMPNPGEKLWPGAFANVVLVTGTETNALTVPSSAVQIGQRGSYVFTVKDGKATLKLVTVERVAGNLTVIAAGIAAGDEVVVSGQMALTDGADVTTAKTGETKPAPEKTASAG